MRGFWYNICFKQKCILFGGRASQARDNFFCLVFQSFHVLKCDIFLQLPWRRVVSPSSWALFVWRRFLVFPSSPIRSMDFLPTAPGIKVLRCCSVQHGLHGVTQSYNSHKLARSHNLIILLLTFIHVMKLNHQSMSTIWSGTVGQVWGQFRFWFGGNFVFEKSRGYLQTFNVLSFKLRFNTSHCLSIQYFLLILTKPPYLLLMFKHLIKKFLNFGIAIGKK